MLDKKLKQDIITTNATHDGDTGSPQVQVALLSKRIEEITAHLKSFPKDFHSRNGLLKLIGRRRKLMSYLGRTNPTARGELVASLGLRK